MPVLARIIVIRRNGLDGSQFPITGESCVFGRASDCDIRIQLPFVSREQCKLMLGKTGYSFHNMSETNVTNINNKPVEENYTLQDKDIITIVDRSFRFEYPDNSPFLKNLKTPETSSDQKAPFREIQENSPFGMLVKDMKNILKNTPRKGKKTVAVNKVEHKPEEKGTPKTTQSQKATPKAKRRSKSVTPKRTPRSKKIMKDSLSSSPTVDDNNVSLPEPESSALGADVSSAQKTISPRRRSNIGSSMPEILPGAISTENQKLCEENVTSEIGKAEDLEKDLPKGEDVADKSKQSNKAGKDFTVSADDHDLVDPAVFSESRHKGDSNDNQKNEEELLKNITEPVKRRRSSRRSSVLNDVPNSIGSSNAVETEEMYVSVNPLNSEVIGARNITMTPESNNDESVKVDSTVKTKSPRRRSSLTRNLSKKDVGDGDVANVSIKSVTPQKNTVDEETMLTDVPKISLTPSKEHNETISSSNEDPYSFRDITPSNSANSKKWRRRSSGPSSMSKKKALMLFGSPRVQNVTPLRRSMSKLKQKSEPLVEDNEELEASPVSQMDPEKKSPPAEEIEVENNSSPIKKPRRSVVASTASNLVISPAAAAAAKVSRRVSFGPNLSPEQFLKMLPPNTPVRKGKTPAFSTRSRKSLAAGTTNLSTLAEHEPQSKPSPDLTPKTYQKVNRTPTPFKPGPNKAKQTSLLQQVLRTTMHKNSQNGLDASPTLPLGKRSSSKIVKEPQQESCNDGKEVKEESPRNKELVLRKRRSSSNVQLVNVHKTAVNMYRRRSSRCMSKPLWSEIVKKPAAVTTKTNKKAVSNNERKKKAAKNKTPVLDGYDRHVDSPDTIYIGRTRSRFQNTKTPRPSKSAAPAKLNIPMNESYTGFSELFSTPEPAAPMQDQDDLYDDFKTPKSVGEMLVSPLSNPDTTVNENDVSITTPIKSINFDSETGASPDFSNNADSFVENVEMSNEDAGSTQVKEHFGTKRLLKTPKDSKKTIVQDNFGTKRLMRTPRDQAKIKPVEEHFGTKKIMKTPKNLKKLEPVEEHFGTKRILRTPRDLKKSGAVEEHFGTKRLFKTPKDLEKSESVEEHFGTKRIMRTPRDLKKSEAVEEHFGTKRLMRTPRDTAKTDPVKEHFGTKRLLQSKRNTDKSEPVKDKFGLKRMFHVPKEKVVVEENSDDDFCLNQIMASPVSITGEPPSKKQKIDGDVILDIQPSANQAAGKVDKPNGGSAQKDSTTRRRKASSKSNKGSLVNSKAMDEDQTPLESSGDQPASEVSSVSVEDQKIIALPDNASVEKAADPVERTEAEEQAVPVKAKANRHNKKVIDESAVVSETATSADGLMKSEQQHEDLSVNVRKSSRSRKAVTFHLSVKPDNDQVQEVKQNATKPQQKRGRIAKKVEVPAVAEKDVEETPASVASATKGGRATRAQKQDEGENSPESETSEILVPTAKATARSRRSKVSQQNEDEARDVKTKPATKARLRRAKESQPMEETSTEDITSSSDSQVEEMSSKIVTRRGRSRAAIAKAAEEPVSIIPTVESSEEPARKVAKRKQTRSKTMTKEVATAEKEESSEVETQENVAPIQAPTRRGRSRKVQKENDQMLPVTAGAAEEPVSITPTVEPSEEPVRKVAKRKQTRSKTMTKEVATAEKEESSEVETQENVAPIQAPTRTGRSRKVQKENDQMQPATAGAAEEPVSITPTVEPSEEPVRKVAKRKQTRSKTMTKEVATAEKEESSEVETQEIVAPIQAPTRRGRSRKVQKENDQMLPAAEEPVSITPTVESSEEPARKVAKRKQTTSKTMTKEETEIPTELKASENLAPVKPLTRRGRSKSVTVEDENDQIKAVTAKSSEGLAGAAGAESSTKPAVKRLRGRQNPIKKCEQQEEKADPCSRSSDEVKIPVPAKSMTRKRAAESRQPTALRRSSRKCQ